MKRLCFDAICISVEYSTGRRHRRSLLPRMRTPLGLPGTVRREEVEGTLAEGWVLVLALARVRTDLRRGRGSRGFLT